MKLIKLFSILVIFALSLTTSNEANAQVVDSLPFFKTDLLLLDDYSFMRSGAPFIIPRRSQAKVVMYAANLPSVKKINSPIVLRQGDNCYKVGCAKTKECADCSLLWWDKNTDGKIQPKKELRCACSNTKNTCKLRAEEVECKKKKNKS